MREDNTKMREVNTLKIRKAKIADLAQLQEVFSLSIENTCSRDYDETQINSWKSSVENKQRWVEAIENQYFLLAEIGDLILGFASLKDGDYIDFLYVHHEHLRKGIADKLFQALASKSVQLGKDRLMADVSKTARPFFEKKGFITEKMNINTLKGVELINYRMISTSLIIDDQKPCSHHK